MTARGSTMNYTPEEYAKMIAFAGIFVGAMAVVGRLYTGEWVWESYF